MKKKAHFYDKFSVTTKVSLWIRFPSLFTNELLTLLELTMSNPSISTQHLIDKTQCISQAFLHWAPLFHYCMNTYRNLLEETGNTCIIRIINTLNLQLIKSCSLCTTANFLSLHMYYPRIFTSIVNILRYSPDIHLFGTINKMINMLGNNGDKPLKLQLWFLKVQFMNWTYSGIQLLPEAEDTNLTQIAEYISHFFFPLNITRIKHCTEWLLHTRRQMSELFSKTMLQSPGGISSKLRALKFNSEFKQLWYLLLFAFIKQGFKNCSTLDLGTLLDGLLGQDAEIPLNLAVEFLDQLRDLDQDMKYKQLIITWKENISS